VIDHSLFVRMTVTEQFDLTLALACTRAGRSRLPSWRECEASIRHEQKVTYRPTSGEAPVGKSSRFSSPVSASVPKWSASRVFRGKFHACLRRAFAAGELRFFGALSGLAEASAFGRWLQPLSAREWVVYAKPPFGGPEVVLKYLARYTHRVAIGNRRLVSWSGGVHGQGSRQRRARSSCVGSCCTCCRVGS